MKKKLLILTIILLGVIIGFEGYFYIQSLNEASIVEKGSSNDETKNKEDMSKYLADIFTPYNQDNLTYTVKNEKTAIYYLIEDGLIDTNIQTKVNEKITKKIKNLTEKYKDDIIEGRVISNFENTISIIFRISHLDDRDTENFNNWLDEELISTDFIDSLNIDLNTGEEIKINDVIIDDELFRGSFLKQMEENLSKMIGLVCEGGPCQNPSPDYSVLEDEYLSIINKLNKGQYIFAFNPTGIFLHFEDLSLYDPNLEFWFDEDRSKCQKDGYKFYDEMGCINFNNYSHEYNAKINFHTFSDNILIYNRFKTDKSIYKNASTVVPRKFTLVKNEGMDERLIETNDTLIDYNLSFYSEDKIAKEVYDRVIKESSSMKKGEFSILNYSGLFSDYFLTDNYYYIYFNVYGYSLSKEEYLKNKKQIYLDKYTRYSFDEADVNYRLGYDYLKDHLTKKSYYYYIYDKNGNKVSTADVYSKNFDFSTILPSEWLTNESIYNLLNNSLVIVDNDNFSSPNRLVFYYSGDSLYMKYKGQKVILSSTWQETDKLIKKIFRME